jgi:alpha-L-rhamnosidase
LARKTKDKGEVIGTGFFGTGVINPMLTEGGHTDLAYKLLLQTKYPSWLYPVTQGATTIWERWNSYTVENGFGGNNSMNSFNHYSLGSVLSWIYETVLGIQRDEDCPGYKHFSLKPAMMVLESAKGGFETGYGRIESSWEQLVEGGYLYKCDIPCNTSADVCLGLDDNKYVAQLGSGHYEFICKKDGSVINNA